RSVRRRIGDVRACSGRRLADRRASAPGRRCRAAAAARAHAAERGLPAREARRGNRHLQRDHRHRRGGRTVGRRRRHAGDQLGVDLLAERADRADCRPIGADEDEGELRPGQRTGRSRLALVTAGAFGVVWGLVRGNSAGWGSAEVIIALVVGCLLLAAFVAWERRAPEPMLPTHFFRVRSFAAGNAAIFFTFASLFGAVFFAAQLMQTGLGYG